MAINKERQAIASSIKMLEILSKHQFGISHATIRYLKGQPLPIVKVTKRLTHDAPLFLVQAHSKTGLLRPFTISERNAKDYTLTSDLSGIGKTSSRDPDHYPVHAWT